MDHLSVQVQDRLYTYIYRLTLNEHLAHDIVQETLLQMVRSLQDLNRADRFMPWLYKTAWGKVQNHFRSTKSKKHVSLDNSDHMIDVPDRRTPDGLEALVSREVAEALVRALDQLDARQKNVLILRCFDNLSFWQIAQIMNCSETSVRVLLFRARQSLCVLLRRKGVVTKTMFLGLLGVFGQATSSSKAAVTVSGSALETGAVAALLGYIAWKTGTSLLAALGLAGLVAACVFALSGSTVSPLVNTDPVQGIKSFHFIEQAWQNTIDQTNTNLLMGKSLSKGGYEKWFFFPEGVNGPMFQMIQRWDPSLQNRLCGWLLDGDGQKYYGSGINTIYLLNAPMCKVKTMRYPSDSAEFCAFLDRIEGPQAGVQYKRDPESGLLVELTDYRFSNAQNFSSKISYNVLDERSFDSFRYKWQDAQIIDERDEIHKTGWTVFELQGTVGDRPVQGRCRVPLVYNQVVEYPPLLQLQVGEKTLVDCPAGAYVLDKTNTIAAAYPSGTFFKAFTRPWFGIHMLDIIRRDAACHRIPFAVEDLLYDESIAAPRKRCVTLYDAPNCPDIKIALLVNMEMSRVESIRFLLHDQQAGLLQCTYPTAPDELPAGVELPAMKKPLRLKQRTPDTLWLFKLAKDTLGE
jgi:RNA polymerase sigma-70 factor (ECF subfamily)